VAGEGTSTSAGVKERSTAGPVRPARPGAEVPVLPRIPFLLLHFRALLAALVLVAALLVVAVASGPLFLSSAGDRAATLEVASLRGEPALTVSSYGPLSAGFRSDATGALARALSGLPDLAPLDVAVTGISLGVVAGGATVPAFAVGREDFVGHLSPVGPHLGAGIWVPASLASRIEPGGTTLMVEAGGQQRSVQVAGVYRDLDPDRLSAFWRSSPGAAEAVGGTSPMPLLLSTPADLIEALGGLVPTARFQWDAPIARPQVALPDAVRLSAGIERVRSSLAVLDVPPGSVLSGDGGAVPFSVSPLPVAVAGAAAARDELRSSTEAISLAAVVIALAAMAAAGTLATRRRQVQAELLSARGLGPAGQGVLAAAEAFAPAALGAAIGWVVVVALVRAFGPSPHVDALARAVALRRAIQAAGLGVVLYGLAAGFAARPEQDLRLTTARRLAAARPWEPVVLVVAGAALYEILTRAVPTSPAPDLLLLAFPLLFVAGLAGLAARALPRAAAALRRRVPPARLAAFFAVRRVARDWRS
jgi:hypothetical protein